MVPSFSGKDTGFSSQQLEFESPRDHQTDSDDLRALGIYCGVEQWLAHWPHKPEIVGSNPTLRNQTEPDTPLNDANHVGSFNNKKNGGEL